MNTTVRRWDCLQAIWREPLRQGSWVREEPESKNNGVCAVCAVGAVFRGLGVDDDGINNAAETYVASKGFYCSVGDKLEVKGRIDLELNAKHYLNALSVYFESLPKYQGANSRKTRLLLAKFIRKNFPKTFTLSKDTDKVGDNENN